MYGGDYSSIFNSSMGSMYKNFDVWDELLPGENGELINEAVKEQYRFFTFGDAMLII